MPDIPLPKKRHDFLDVARGLAALMVLAEHGLDCCFPDCLSSLLGRGNLGRAGVMLFLLVSGFIIPASIETGGSNARFWLRRFFRLFPAYWLSIAVAFGFCGFSGWHSPEAPLKTGDWFLNLTMLQGFFNRPHVWGVFWTLQLELVIYASFSLLYASRLWKWSGRIAVLAMTAYFVIGLSRPLLEGKPFGVGGNSFLYFAPLLGFVAQRHMAGLIGHRGLPAVVLGQAFLLPTVWLVNHALFPAEMTGACLWNLICTWGIACSCFFLLLAARRKRMPPGGCWLGRISYPVYLFHPFVLVVLGPANWPAWVFLPALLASVLLLAEAVHRLVERPGIALGRAVERRWLPAPTKPTSGATPLRRAA
jgi:peptidoglycan/LPS O-acetylase OafA/YrhL